MQDHSQMNDVANILMDGRECIFDVSRVEKEASEIIENICNIFNCKIDEVTEIKAIKAGLTNISFTFEISGEIYVYRHPGAGTENFVNRVSEFFSMEHASRLGLDETYVHMDSCKGWKISKFIKNAREMDYHNESEVDKALGLMKKLHSARIISDFDFDIWKKTLDFVEVLKSESAYEAEGEGGDELFSLMEEVHKKVTSDNYSQKCLCHCDCYSPNFLLNDKDEIFLIDWEYSGNDDPASDLGTFICCSDYGYKESVDVIKKYLGYEPVEEELTHYFGYIAEASYYWYVWAVFQRTKNNDVGEWEQLWLKNTRFFALLTLGQ